MLLKKSNEYILIAIEAADGKNVIVDLYCTRADTIVNLHASAKLGQRKFFENQWPAWVWWNNENWSANVSRLESFDKLSFHKENAREFQLHKSFFSANNTSLFLEITFINTDNSTNAVFFPEKCQNTNSENWMRIEWR